jgi:nicotinamidase-related amidase
MDYHPQNHFSFAKNSPFNKTSFSFVDAAYDKSSRICGKEYVELYGGSATEKCDEHDVEVNFSQELWPVHCVQGTWGQKIDDRVQIPATATIVKKGLSTVVDSYGAFEDNFVYESKATISPGDMKIISENNLATLLKLADVENVYMTGLALDYCVKYTALQALDRNFSTYLIEDATKAVIDEQGVQAIAHLRKEGVGVVNASAVPREASGDEASHSTCYDLYSSMQYNNLVQYFQGNPDSEAKGFTTCSLCTNGTFSCSALVYGGKTPLIASHIHLASDGDGVNGNGDPVLSFCGDNTPGLIHLDTAYPEMCAPYSKYNSNNPNMKGVFLATPPNSGMSVKERVRDIAEYPGKYYFNFHSLASWQYWLSQNEGPRGMCRGVMELS